MSLAWRVILSEWFFFSWFHFKIIFSSDRKHYLNTVTKHVKCTSSKDTSPNVKKNDATAR